MRRLTDEDWERIEDYFEDNDIEFDYEKVMDELYYSQMDRDD